MSTITVTNRIQQALLICELQGQISDGFWENSRPYDHWKQPATADVVIGEIASVDFYPQRAYNFANKELLECVGDRMIIFAKMAIKYPQLSTGVYQLTDMGKWAWEKDDYYISEKQELSEIGVTDYPSLQKMIEDLSGISYEMKDLKKDLKQIKVAFSNVIRS